MPGRTPARHALLKYIIHDLADGQQLVCCVQTQAVQKYQFPANTL